MRKRNSGFLLAFPALAGFLVFYFVPFLITVWYSVSFGIGRREFVGLDNFRDLYTNEMFLLAVKNTLRYMAVTVPTTLFGALLLSVTLQNTTKGVRFFQLSFLYPMILPIASVILGVQFLWGSSGIWNKVVELLQMIPKEYYEYAALFGAGKVQSFRYITLPILLPTITFTIVLSIMNAFKCYREAFLLGGNYPNDSIYLLQHFMNNNFQNLNYQKISSAAVSIVLLLILFTGICYALYRIVERGK